MDTKSLNILYIASVRIPNEKASGLAIMRQCEAFALLGHVVTLIRPRRINHLQDDPFLFYGMKRNFNLLTMKTPDLVDFLGVFGTYFTRCIQMFSSFYLWFSRRHAVDVLYSRDALMLMLPCVLNTNTKIIWEPHQPQKGIIAKIVLSRADRVVCISSGLKEYFQQLSGRQDISVEPSGVNLEQFEQVLPQSVVREKFGIPVHKKVIGYIGKYTTMGEEKGVHELISAFAKIQDTHPDAHLLIAGLESHEIPKVKSICDQEGIEAQRLSLHELIQKDFAEYIQAADVLVMNYPDTEHYRKYMSPTKLFAYLASGKLIISSDLPSVREIVDEKIVRFVPPGDISSLANALSNAISNTSIHNPERAKELINRFSWHNRASRILRIWNLM